MKAYVVGKNPSDILESVHCLCEKGISVKHSSLYDASLPHRIKEYDPDIIVIEGCSPEEVKVLLTPENNGITIVTVHDKAIEDYHRQSLLQKGVTDCLIKSELWLDRVMCYGRIGKLLKACSSVF